jgi:recombination protein RecR
MNSIDKLTQIFSEFPGIGPRQAKRFVYHLLSRNESYIAEFLDLAKNLKKEIRVCPDCFRYFPKNATTSPLCPICQSPNRDKNSLMIVSRDVDLESIEKSHSFEGYYFVLGGTIPILDKEPGKRIRLAELKKIITRRLAEGLKEIILGLNANPDGDYTGQFIIETFQNEVSASKIKISHLGRGLSTGTELEYSDSDTIKSALENRR